MWRLVERVVGVFKRVPEVVVFNHFLRGNAGVGGLGKHPSLECLGSVLWNGVGEYEGINCDKDI